LIKAGCSNHDNLIWYLFTNMSPTPWRNTE